MGNTSRVHEFQIRCGVARPALPPPSVLCTYAVMHWRSSTGGKLLRNAVMFDGARWHTLAFIAYPYLNLAVPIDDDSEVA